MMDIKETNNFYQIKSDHYSSKDFIIASMINIGGFRIFIEFVNDLDEKLGLNFETINEATEWIEKGFWVKICVTVYK